MNAIVKKNLRKHFKKLLQNIDSDNLLSTKICHNLKQFFFDFNSLYLLNSLNSIGGFAPIKNEPDLVPFYDFAFTQGVFCSFPSFIEKQMIYKVCSIQDMSVTREFGVELLTPHVKNQTLVPDVVLVPGLGFDFNGNRLGHGRGFFDRFLSNYKGVKVAVCFNGQIVQEIPTEIFDEKMDYIISEVGIIKIKNK